MKLRLLSAMLVAVSLLAADRVAVIDLTTATDQGDIAAVDGGIVWTLPDGKGQTIRFDLAKLGIDPAAYDELRFDIHPQISQVSMATTIYDFPEAELLSRWYLKFKTPTGVWTSGQYDLRLDDDGAFVKPKTYGGQVLELRMGARQMGYPGEPVARRTGLRNLRFVRHLVSIDVDLLEARYEQDAAVVATTYVLHLRNRSESPQPVTIDPDSRRMLHHFSAECPRELTLQPGEERAVELRLSLSTEAAMALPRLYAEPAYPVVSVPGVADGDAAPLRGFRRFPLWAVVPIFGERDWTPAEFQARYDGALGQLPGLDGWRKRIVHEADEALAYTWPAPLPGPPIHDQQYRCKACGLWLKPETPVSFHRHVCPKCGKVWDHDPIMDGSGIAHYTGARVHNVEALSFAWMLTGEEKYARQAVAILRMFADAAPHLNVIGMRSTAGRTRLGWASLASSYRLKPLAVGWTFLRGFAMSEDDRVAILGFLRDEANRVSFHSTEYTNQTAEHNAAYGGIGLATGFWPLAAESIHGEFGFHQLVEYGYTAEGIGHEGSAYHYAMFGAMNEQAMLASVYGLDLYTARYKRVFDGSLASGLARTPYELAYRAYRDPSYVPLLQSQRQNPGWVNFIHGTLALPDVSSMPIASDHLPGSGYLYLRTGNVANYRELRLNYVNQFDRTEHDRFSTLFMQNGRQVDGGVGRITYSDPHAHWMYATAAQNCLVVDGEDAGVQPQQLVAASLDGPVPAAAVISEGPAALYSGVRQLRLVAMVDTAWIVFDLAAAEQPHTFDRYQWGIGKPTLTPVAKPVDALPHLPEAGEFHTLAATALVGGLRVSFANGLAMRLVADGDLRGCQAITVGGYQGRPMEVTWARREGKSAAFLAAFALGGEPPEVSIVSADLDRPACCVVTPARTVTITLDRAAGKLAIQDVPAAK